MPVGQTALVLFKKTSGVSWGKLRAAESCSVKFCCCWTFSDEALGTGYCTALMSPASYFRKHRVSS